MLELAIALNVQGSKLLGSELLSTLNLKITIIMLRCQFDACFEADLVLSSLRTHLWIELDNYRIKMKK